MKDLEGLFHERIEKRFRKDQNGGLFDRDESEIIYAPFSGEVILSEEIPDENFAAGLSGVGGAILPDDDIALSPVDSRISFILPTSHALGMISKKGIEIFLHIGINTAELEGEGFNALVKEGQKVSRGEPLISFNKEFIERNGYSLISPILIRDDDVEYETKDRGIIEAGEPFLAVAKHRRHDGI